MLMSPKGRKAKVKTAILSDMNYDELALRLHKEYKGKITTSLRDTSDLDKEKLSAYYTPGVAAVSKAIADDPSLLPTYTWTNNLVAVISDGSAVLGLGNIGPKGSMPVMEGKALLFKHFAGIDSIPITLDVHTPDEIVATVKAISSSFGAINLEDIAAPQCFEIEERLKEELDIPVFHDDQHGTAVVVLAGLINAARVTNKKIEDMKIVVVGAGAAGTAIIKLLHTYAKPRIFAADSKGIISKNRSDLNDEKKKLLEYTNLSGFDGSLEDILAQGADVFIGVSKPGLLTKEMVKSMDKDPIIFALANPIPEIMPDEAKAAGAAIVATGRSDFPNQVNNAIAFPGIFRGALDNGVQKITDQHKIAAAEAIAALVEQPTADSVIPTVFDERLVPAIANVIR
jgi:malate dehydrogenase (oxaloacetate-decarboxylating)